MSDLDTLEAAARRELAEVYKPDGIDMWMRARQNRWGGLTAREMIVAGRSAEVFAAIEQMVTGAFA